MFVFTRVLPRVHICVHVVWFFCHWGGNVRTTALAECSQTHTAVVPPSAAAICAGNIEGVKEADSRNGKGID